MPKISDTSGAILAGGRSERFGTNKAFARFQGTPLIQRVVTVMQDLFDEITLVTHTPELYESLGVPAITDWEPHLGPLGGIFTALRNSSSEKVFVVACDMPILDPAVIREIIRTGNEADAAIPFHDGIREYLMALYSRRLLPDLCLALKNRRLSVKEFCSKVADVVWVPIGGDSWQNINTEKELRQLESCREGGAL